MKKRIIFTKELLIMILWGIVEGISTNLSHSVTPAFLNTINLSHIFGYCFSSMSLGMLIFAPIWGSLGDVKSRKWALLICIYGYSLGQIMFGLFTNPYLIIFARFFSGSFSGGILVSSLSLIAEDPRYQENRSTILSSFVAFQVVGASLAYLIGGQLSRIIDYKYVIVLQGLICSLSSLYVIFVLKIKQIQREHEKRASIISNIMSLKKLSPLMLIFMFSIMITSISQTILSKYTDVYITDLGFKASDIGNYMFFVGLISLLVNVFITPIIIKKIPLKVSLPLIQLLSAFFAFLTYYFSHNILLMIYTTYMLYNGFKAIYDPVVVNHLNENKKTNPGILLGIRQSFISLGAVVGPLIATLIYSKNRVWTFYFSSILLVASSLIFFIYTLYQKKVD